MQIDLDWTEDSRDPLSLYAPIDRTLPVARDDVGTVLEALANLGYYDAEASGIPAREQRDVHDAIERFQEDHGLARDGVMQPNGPTLLKLNRIFEQRREDKFWRQQAEQNAQRTVEGRPIPKVVTGLQNAATGPHPLADAMATRSPLPERDIAQMNGAGGIVSPSPSRKAAAIRGQASSGARPTGVRPIAGRTARGHRQGNPMPQPVQAQTPLPPVSRPNATLLDFSRCVERGHGVVPVSHQGVQVGTICTDDPRGVWNTWEGTDVLVLEATDGPVYYEDAHGNVYMVSGTVQEPGTMWIDLSTGDVRIEDAVSPRRSNPGQPI